MTTHADIETALNTALATLKTAGVFRYAAVMNAGAIGPDELLRTLGAQPPFAAMFLSALDTQPLNQAAKKYRAAAEWSAVIGVGRTTGTKSEGSAIATLAAKIINAIGGEKLGLDIQAFRPGPLRWESWSDQLAVFVVTFSTVFEWDAAAEAS